MFSPHHFIDFHTHSQRQLDVDDVIEIVSIHLGQEKEASYYTIGMHPWWTDDLIKEEQEKQLFALLAYPNCLGMGEIGLDRLKGPPIHKQMQILRELLTIADKKGESVVIHCVRAFDQLIQLKKEFPSIKNWCIHGYGRHGILARQLLDQGFYLSLMPGMPEDKLQELLEVIPFDRLFLETDSMPETDIKTIYQQAASLSAIDISHLCQQLMQNLNTFFNL